MPVSGNIASFACSGTMKVETLDQLNAYKNSLGVVAKKPTVASAHKVYQCGGWGCEGVMYGYYIPLSSTDIPQKRVSSLDVFDF